MAYFSLSCCNLVDLWVKANSLCLQLVIILSVLKVQGALWGFRFCTPGKTHPFSFYLEWKDIWIQPATVSTNHTDFNIVISCMHIFSRSTANISFSSLTWCAVTNGSSRSHLLFSSWEESLDRSSQASCQTGTDMRFMWKRPNTTPFFKGHCTTERLQCFDIKIVFIVKRNKNENHFKKIMLQYTLIIVSNIKDMYYAAENVTSRQTFLRF